MARVLLTGASGFVGSAILAELLARGHTVSLLSRRGLDVPPEVRQIITGDFGGLDAAFAREAVMGHDAIIHAAGHAHAEDGSGGELHRRINREASILLAQAAASAGAYFIYLSSIRAQVGTNASGIVREDDLPRPDDAYGIAKLEAENAIRLLLPGRHTILRPVLVCGPGAKGNLAALMRLAMLPVPLPFGAVEARRSLISRDDLAAIAVEALEAPALAGRTIITADPKPLTLVEIVTNLRAGLGRSPRLFSLPPSLLAATLGLLGRKGMAQRLFSPLIAEPSTLLASGWRPRMPAAEALKAMARYSLRR